MALYYQSKSEMLSKGISISEGNIKVGAVPSFSTLPGDDILISAKGEKIIDIIGTCKGVCGECKKNCYAMRMARGIHRYVIAPAWGRNTYLVREEPKIVERQLIDYISRKRPASFRLHVGGECETTEQMKMYFRVAKACPETHFYIYTKNTDIIDKIFQFSIIKRFFGMTIIPENFHINISQWHNTVKNNHNLPEFVYDDGTDPLISALPHCPAVDKSGHETGFQCQDCKRCMYAKNGSKTAVYAH